MRHPKINGKDIDLYQLYTEVTKLGGWVKVNQRNDWDEILEAIDFPRSCVNAPVAIKYIYIRYLDRYEKLNFLGEEVERVVEDDEDVRQKKMSSRFLHNIPMTYNHVQHVVSDANRLTHKLSTDYFKLSEYEKLFMSLLSPLPNEQDFAINVCTLMANETKSSLKVEKCPKLIDALLAHAGVYSHCKALVVTVVPGIELIFIYIYLQMQPEKCSPNIILGYGNIHCKSFGPIVFRRGRIYWSFP